MITYRVALRHEDVQRTGGARPEESVSTVVPERR